MNKPIARASLLNLWLVFFVAAQALAAQEAYKAIHIAVDLREAPKRIYHAKMEYPVAAGPLTLVYPKWIPGEHGPNGPIVDVTGIRFRAPPPPPGPPPPPRAACRPWGGTAW